MQDYKKQDETELTIDDLYKELEQTYEEIAEVEKPLFSFQESINQEYADKLKEYNELKAKLDKENTFLNGVWRFIRDKVWRDGIQALGEYTYHHFDHLIGGNEQTTRYSNQGWMLPSVERSGELLAIGLQEKLDGIVKAGMMVGNGFNSKEVFTDLKIGRQLRQSTNRLQTGFGGIDYVHDKRTQGRGANDIFEQTVEAIGGMIPQIATSIMTGGTGVFANAGLAVMGVSAFGNAGEEAYNMGADNSQILKYSTLTAGVAVATEKMFNSGVFAKFYGKGIFDDKVSGVMSQNAMQRMLKSAMEEGFEEAIEELASPLIKTISFDDTGYLQEYATVDFYTEVMQNFIVGAMSSAVLQGASDLSQNITKTQRVINQANSMVAQLNTYNQYAGLEAQKQMINPHKIKSSLVQTTTNLERQINKLPIEKRQDFINKYGLTNIMEIRDGEYKVKKEVHDYFSITTDKNGKASLTTPNHSVDNIGITLEGNQQIYTKDLSPELEVVKGDLQRSGVSFVFADLDKNTNAYSRLDGTLVLNANNEANAVKVALIHELTHMLELDSSEAVEKAINERKAVDKEFEERVNKVAEEIRELYQEQASMFTEQETKDFLYKTELVAGLLETDIAYDMAIDLIENKPSVFRKMYNSVNEKYQIKKASSIEAKAELKYYSELRKAYQKALNHKGGMVDLRLLDYQYFADRLEQNENGIFYKHAGGQLEQVFVFNDGQMLDETILNEMYQALYSERLETQIKQEQQKAQTLIELARINNKYRILDIEKDIVFGKFDIEQNKIISLDEYNAKYSSERNDVNPSNRYSLNKDIEKTNEMKYTELVGEPISAETSQLANVEYEREHLKTQQWLDNNKTQIDNIKKANEPYYNRIISGEIIDVNELINLETVRQTEKLVHSLGTTMIKRFGELIDKKNTPERQALRDRIVYDYFEKNAKGVRFDRVAHIVLGIASAGKSSVFINDIKKNFGSLELDSDIVKAMLPEYADGYGANAVHEESSYILESIITPKAIESGANLAFAFVGKNSTKIENLINNLKQNGYEVALALNELPVEKAVNRSFTRWYEIGRFVPLSYIAETNNDPDRTPVNTFEKIKEKGVADSYERKSNDVKFGDKPKVISLDGKTELFSTNDRYSDGQRLLSQRNTNYTGEKSEHRGSISNETGDGRLIKNDPSNRYSLKRGENLKRDKNFRNFSNAVDKALMSTIDWDSIYEKYTDGIFDIFVNKNAIYGILNQYKDDINELAKLRDARNVLNIEIEQELINKMADSLFTSLVYDPNSDAKYVLPELKRVKSAMDKYNNKKGGIHIGDIEWAELKYKLDTRNKRTRRGTLTANNIALQWKKDGGSDITTVINELIGLGFTELTDINNLYNDADKLIRFFEFYESNKSHIDKLENPNYIEASRKLSNADVESMTNKFKNDLKPILKAYIENLPIIKAYEVIPYSVGAEFFTVDDTGNKTTDINYQWVRNNLSSRIRALYTQTDFAFLPQLNSTENTIKKRNEIAHQLLDHTIQDMLEAEQSNLTLQEVIKLNDQAYKNLRLYVRNMFAEMEKNVQHSMITDIHDKIGKIREMYKLQQSQVQYKYNHPEQVKMMLEVLSSFRDGVITHDKKTGTKRLNAKNIRNQASNLLMEVDIPVEIDGVETLVKRPLIRLYSPDLDTITEIEKTLYELASRKDSDAVLTTQEMKQVQDMLNTLIKRTQIEVEFEFGNMQSRTVADIVNQGVGEIEIMRNSKENRQQWRDFAYSVKSPINVFDTFSMGRDSIVWQMWEESFKAVSEEIAIKNDAHDMLSLFLDDGNKLNDPVAERRRLKRLEREFNKWSDKRFDKITIADGDLKVELPRTQWIYLLMTWKREATRKHVLGYHYINGKLVHAQSKSQEVREYRKALKKQGKLFNEHGDYGILSVADYDKTKFRDTRKALRNKKQIIINENILNQIEQNLTETDIKFMEALRTVFDNFAGMTNEAYMERLGVPFISEDNYFPVYVDDADLNTNLGFAKPKSYNFDKGSAWFLKPLTMNADQRIFITDVLDMMNSYIKQYASWKAWYLPLYKINRVYNAKVDIYDENGNLTKTRANIKNEMYDISNRFDKWLTRYFDDVKTYGSHADNDTINRWVKKLRSNYITATFGLNPRIIFTQFTSLIASGQSGYNVPQVLMNFFKSFISTEETKAIVEQIREHSPVLYDRITDGGLIIGEVRRQERNTKFSRFASFLTNGIQYVDGRIVLATYRSALEMFDGDIEKAVKFTEENLMRTQANWHPALRPQITRTRSELTQLYTVFMSEPFAILSQMKTNIDNRAKYEALANDTNLTEEQRTKYNDLHKSEIKNGINITASITAQMLFLAFVQTFWRAFNHYKSDLDDETTYLQMYAEELAGEIIGLFPLVKEIVNAFNSNFAIGTIDTQSLNRVANAMTNIYKLGEHYLTGKGGFEPKQRKQLMDAFIDIGTVLGMPVRNMRTYARGFLHTVSGEAGYAFDSWFEEKFYRSDYMKYVGQDNDRMATAVSSKVIKNPSLRDEVLRLNKNGYTFFPKVITTQKISYNGEVKDVSLADKYEMKDVYKGFEDNSAKMINLAIFRNLSDKEKQKALNTMSNYYYNLAKDTVFYGDTVAKTREMLKSIDISTLSVIVAKVSELQSDNISSKKEKVINYLNTLNLTDYQKKKIMEYLGYKVELKEVKKKAPAYKSFDTPKQKTNFNYMNTLKKQLGI